MRSEWFGAHLGRASLQTSSKVSTCEIAPCMNKKIARLALAGKCGSLGERGPAAGGAALADDWPSSPASAR